MGGALAPSVAAIAVPSGLTPPKAIMSVEPGKTWAKSERAAYDLEDLSKIPAGTPLLSLYGEDDRLVKETDARRIYEESTAIPTSDKNLLMVRSDAHGSPKLTANHFAPTSAAPMGVSDGGDTRRQKLRQRIQNRFSRDKKKSDDSQVPADALDYYAYCGVNREFALGNTPQQRSMGLWSDGTPVKEIQVVA